MKVEPLRLGFVCGSNVNVSVEAVADGVAADDRLARVLFGPVAGMLHPSRD